MRRKLQNSFKSTTSSNAYEYRIITADSACIEGRRLHVTAPSSRQLRSEDHCGRPNSTLGQRRALTHLCGCKSLLFRESLDGHVLNPLSLLLHLELRVCLQTGCQRCPQHWIGYSRRGWMGLRLERRTVRRVPSILEFSETPLAPLSLGSTSGTDSFQVWLTVIRSISQSHCNYPDIKMSQRPLPIHA